MVKWNYNIKILKIKKRFSLSEVMIKQIALYIFAFIALHSSQR